MEEVGGFWQEQPRGRDEEFGLNQGLEEGTETQ